MWICKQTKYKLFLCCTVSIVLMSSFCSTIITFAQNHGSPSFGPILYRLIQSLILKERCLHKLKIQILLKFFSLKG